MLALFNHLFDSGTAPPELLKASIVTIPKPGKDPTLCSNYRPISLLNVDIKIYAKILANRVAPLLPKLVADDQVGFIQGRQGTDNTVRLLNIIDGVGRDTTPCLLLSLDAEKAFDRLSWLFLRHVLLKFNFPLPFIEAVFTLYSSPTAQVLNAGFLSDTITITNGTRQGCPLSPLLYALALEPLAQAIRADSEITGVHIGPTESRISLFADDILLTLTDPVKSIPQLHHLLNQYGKVSYHQINVAKTQALGTHLSPTDLTYLRTTYKYDWRAVYLTYLGIKISFSRPTLYRLNYGAMLSTIKELCWRWARFEFSWLGRIAVIKMSILPKLLYLFRALPVSPHPTFVKTLQTAINQFVWRRRRPRVGFRVLSTSVVQGGLGLPNLLLYHKAALMALLSSALAVSPVPQWTLPIFQAISPFKLADIIWLPKHIRPRLHDLLPLITLLIRTWDAMRGQLCHYHPLHLATPITALTHKIPNFDARHWTAHGLSRLVDFYSPRGFMPYAALSERYNIARPLQFSYLQVKTLLAKYDMTGSDRLTRPALSPFETYCVSPYTPARLLSLCYKLMTTSDPVQKCRFQVMWERDLNTTISPEQWAESFRGDRGKFKSASLHEARKKLLYRWYLTPDKLSHFSTSGNSTCWRCSATRGSFVHMWWQCPPLQIFWQDIVVFLNKFLGTALSPDPQILLLQIFPKGMSTTQRKLVAHILTSAYTLIASHWRSPSLPTMNDLKSRVGEVRSLDALADSIAGIPFSTRNHWHIWDVYLNI
uniref:Reverse transcriptase domain-containing protein n=1 Tax=Leptobrachium leishanense TaxID=445787 RepID=A0A8C5PP48_9ANUR